MCSPANIDLCDDEKKATIAVPGYATRGAHGGDRGEAGHDQGRGGDVRRGGEGAAGDVREVAEGQGGDDHDHEGVGPWHDAGGRGDRRQGAEEGGALRAAAVAARAGAAWRLVLPPRARAAKVLVW